MKYKVTYENYPKELPTMYIVDGNVIRYCASTPNLIKGVEKKNLLEIDDIGDGIFVRNESGEFSLGYDEAEYLLIALIDRAIKEGTNVEKIELKKIL